MEFVDIHIHALYGTDDGAKTKQEMLEMLEASYADGVRYLCLTPHSHPGYFGQNHIKAQQRFEELCAEAAKMHPDMHLYLGSELRFAKQAQDWLQQGSCRTLNGTDYVLVDFERYEERGRIVKGLHSLLNAGYYPVLAHAERYVHLDIRSIRELKAHGVVIQVNAGNINRYRIGAPWRARKLLQLGLADVVASDAHDAKKHMPSLSLAYRKVALYLGKHYADKLFYYNPLRLLQGGNR